MSLRVKFTILLFVVSTAILVSVVASVRCMNYYADIAAGRHGAIMSEILRVLVIRNELDDFAGKLNACTVQHSSDSTLDFDVFHRTVEKGLCDLSTISKLPDIDGPEQIRELNRSLSTQGDRYHQLCRNGKYSEATELLYSINLNQVEPMRQLLSQMEGEGTLSATVDIALATDRQSMATTMLCANGLLTLLLTVLCVLVVRRWVMKPVAELRSATRRHAEGDLDFRMSVKSQDELGMLMGEVNQMADSLAAIQRKMVEQARMAAVGEVAASLAHNIRNPLASIRAAMEYWLKNAGANQSMRESLSEAIDRADSLDNWITNLLTGGESPELHLEDIPLRDIVEDVLELSSWLAKNRGVTVRIGESINGQVIHVDRVRMQQAIAAMVDNAVEASPRDAGAIVWITVSSYCDPPEQIKVHISDTGAGIRGNIRKQIGLPYFTTKRSGTGLGLYLARQTVEAHGGTLGFSDNPGGGTVFNFRLPLACQDD